MTLPLGARDARPVGGGDINEAYRVTLADGREAFVKTRPGAAPGEYAAEAAGLRWLAEPGALRTPAVFEVGEDYLALEWVARGSLGAEGAEELGRGLALTHLAGAPGFGGPPSADALPPADAPSLADAPPSADALPPADAPSLADAPPLADALPPAVADADTAGETSSAAAAADVDDRREAGADGETSSAAADRREAARGAAGFGSLRLPNDSAPDWPTFYAERRLRPLARIAREGGALTAAGVRAVEGVCARLPELAGPAEPPARLHGDLWSGNVMADAEGRPWLIDPSCYGGQREIDLAMLRLFGAPSPRVFDAYDEVAPPAAGWEERVQLWQLLPLLVHAVLFGGSYRDAAERVARRYAG